MLSHGFMLARHPKHMDSIKITSLTADEKRRLVNLLAELDHNSWLGKKSMAGWTYGPGDPDRERKTHPGMMLLSDPRAIGKPGCSLKRFRTAEAERFVEHLSDRKHQFYVYFTTPLQDLYAFPGIGQAQENQLKHMHVLYPHGNFHNGRTSQLLASWLNCDQHDALKQLEQSPYFALFIWAIVSKRLMLARMLLEIEPDKAFVRALVGSVICESLYNTLAAVSWIGREEIVEFRECSEWFLGMSKRVLAEASRQDFSTTKSLMQAAYPDSCGLQLYKLAYTVDYHTQDVARNFWTNGATSELLDNLWYGDISQNNGWLKVALGALFPPYISLWAPPRRVQWTEPSTTWSVVRWLSLEMEADRQDRIERGGMLSHIKVRHILTMSCCIFLAAQMPRTSYVVSPFWRLSWCLLIAFGPIHADMTSYRPDTGAFTGHRW